MIKNILLITIITTQTLQNHDYWSATEKSLHFYDAQRSGLLPQDRKTCWRFHSFLKDKGKNCENLTGGWNDAGDYIKFNLPMSSSTTMLILGAIYYKDYYTKAKLFSKLKDTIKWPLKYFMKCYINEKLVYAGCGDGLLDHAQVGTGEDNTTYRPCFELTDAKPGSEVAAGMASALAGAFLVFRDSEMEFAQRALGFARKLFRFADDYRGKYSDHVKDTKQFYNSSGYFDELAEAACLLYKATGEKGFLDKAVAFYDQGGLGNMWGQSWDEKKMSAVILLYDVTRDNKYMIALNKHIHHWIHNVKKIESKLSWILRWGSLRYAANTVFLSLIVYDHFGDNPNLTVKPQLLGWAKNNIDYMLGSNSRNFSYLVGYGINYPRQPHHMGASCPAVPHQCTWNDFNKNAPNPHHLEGALVGGPNEDGSFKDVRSDYVTNEVATDYNAGFTGAVIRFFGTEQTENNVRNIVRTCDNSPDDYIGKSADNFVKYKDFYAGNADSPFEGCAFTPRDDETDDKTDDNTDDKTDDETDDKTDDETDDKTDDETDDKTDDKTDDETDDKTDDNTDDKTDDNTDCVDIKPTAECESKLKSWNMCSNSWWRSQCKKTCCDCPKCPISSKCVDHLPFEICLRKKTNNKCEGWNGYMCQKTCNQCNLSACNKCSKEENDDENKEENDLSPKPEPKPVCEDKIECLSKLEGWDVCGNEYYRKNCGKTCCVCGCDKGLAECRDFIGNCEDFKRWGQCTDGWVGYVCQKTCETCENNACYGCTA